MTSTPVLVPTLSDGDVVLRALGERDVEGCYQQCIDGESVRWTQVPRPYTRDLAREFCLVDAPAAWADGSQWVFAVQGGAVDAPGGYAGNIALRDRGNGLAEIGFGAHPAARGTGVMERAVRLLVEWGFAEQGISTIVWHAKVGNWSSRKLAWRVGFSLDGSVRGAHLHRGELVDAWIGTLLADDPRAPRGTWLVPAPVEGEQLRLRRLSDDDVPRIVEACSDARTQHWLGQMPSPYTEDDAREWMQLNLEGEATGKKLTWAITGRDSDDLLGAINIFDISDIDCEIGYWAHPEARGRGLTSEAMRVVTAYAFRELGVRRVRALAALDNAASRHVIESAGLTQSGVERLGTTLRTGPADIALYDVLVEEWSSLAASEPR